MSHFFSRPRAKSSFAHIHKVVIDGYSFGSKLEASVYMLLKLRLAAGEILSIHPQDKVRICGPIGHECPSKGRIIYKPDFRCETPTGPLWVEAKGFQTPVYRLKRRLWIHNELGRLEVWAGTRHRPSLLEVIGV